MGVGTEVRQNPSGQYYEEVRIISEGSRSEFGCTDGSIRPSRPRPYTSAMDANATTAKTNPTSRMAPKSHSAAKTIGTGSSKNLP
jgi:hypothetical protein